MVVSGVWESAIFNDTYNIVRVIEGSRMYRVVSCILMMMVLGMMTTMAKAEFYRSSTMQVLEDNALARVTGQDNSI